MPLSDFLIISSIIFGLVSIPFLVSGPLSDSIPTGKLVLNMDDSEVEDTPSKMTKTFSSEKFEKTYETAFGKFKVVISGGEVNQELSKPGKVTTVNQNTENTTWKITTQQYQYEIIRTPDSVTQTCTTPDGQMKKIKERGEVTESFQGMNQENVIGICEQAEQDLQIEVEKMQQIVEESEIPSTETKTSQASVKIVEINVDAEWFKLKNAESEVDMNSWGLNNGKETGSGAYTYKFSNFTFEKDGYVYVYSDDSCDITTFVSNETSLCWNKTSVWSPTTDVAVLKDAEGKQVDLCAYTKGDIQDSIVNCE